MTNETTRIPYDENKLYTSWLQNINMSRLILYDNELSTRVNARKIISFSWKLSWNCFWRQTRNFDQILSNCQIVKSSASRQCQTAQLSSIKENEWQEYVFDNSNRLKREYIWYYVPSNPKRGTWNFIRKFEPEDEASDDNHCINFHVNYLIIHVKAFDKSRWRKRSKTFQV